MTKITSVCTLTVSACAFVAASVMAVNGQYNHIAWPALTLIWSLLSYYWETQSTKYLQLLRDCTAEKHGLIQKVVDSDHRVWSAELQLAKMKADLAK